jgi:hypothetical protein
MKPEQVTEVFLDASVEFTEASWSEYNSPKSTQPLRERIGETHIGRDHRLHETHGGCIILTTLGQRI